jgi:hypothetical protein
MDETEIKTRQGLILEGVLAAALSEARFKFAKDHQYDESCEVPDFLIPDESKPRFMVEVHQTEARNSFQMKILRAFTAVTESKAQYGNDLVSVNVLFGDPDTELPSGNVKAMCGIFDVNIVPRRELVNARTTKAMENFALTLAADEDWKTEDAGKEVATKHHQAVTQLAALLKARLPNAKAKPELDDLWNMERARAKGIGKPPLAGDPTYHKRCMLWALFLTDADFAELYANKDPNLCGSSVKKQLVATGLAEVSEEIEGDYYVLKKEFADFLRDSDVLRLRAICKGVLDSEPSMKWFFEDIRDERRRLMMAKIFIRAWSEGLESLKKLFLESFSNGTASGIQHTRCWVGDLLPLVVGRSHNAFNGLIRRSPFYPTSLGNPFNNIVIRSPRLGAKVEVLQAYATISFEVFQAEVARVGVTAADFDEAQVADLIFRFRYKNAIKLQILDPLKLIAAGIAHGLELALDDLTVASIISDLSEDSGAGDFMLLRFTDPKGRSEKIANAVAVHDNHGDDKSKEWGARRLATLYRINKGRVRKSEYQESIFMIDGEWSNKDVTRLHRCGWNHVIRLADLESTLRSVFAIKGKSTALASRKIIPIAAAQADILLAADPEEGPQLGKRKDGNGGK